MKKPDPLNFNIVIDCAVYGVGSEMLSVIYINIFLERVDVLVCLCLERVDVLVCLCLNFAPTTV
jgi:hypothetical protein